MVQTIKISNAEMKLINDLLNLTGDEIYQKYGYKRDETITHAAKFPNGIESENNESYKPGKPVHKMPNNWKRK